MFPSTTERSSSQTSADGKKCDGNMAVMFVSCIYALNHIFYLALSAFLLSPRVKTFFCDISTFFHDFLVLPLMCFIKVENVDGNTYWLTGKMFHIMLRLSYCLLKELIWVSQFLRGLRGLSKFYQFIINSSFRHRLSNYINTVKIHDLIFSKV